MKTRHVLIVFIPLLSILSSCSLIGDVFKAGLWVGIIIVIIVIALLIWLFTKAFGKQ